MIRLKNKDHVRSAVIAVGLNHPRVCAVISLLNHIVNKGQYVVASKSE
jgi:hypothetical protein